MWVKRYLEHLKVVKSHKIEIAEWIGGDTVLVMLRTVATSPTVYCTVSLSARLKAGKIHPESNTINSEVLFVAFLLEYIKWKKPTYLLSFICPFSKNRQLSKSISREWNYYFLPMW